jgi:hypothetical protein
MLRKIKLFYSYIKSIKKNQFELEQKFNLRIDKANRLYTVINVPEDLVGEAYSLKKSDIDRISESFLREYSAELSKYLNKIELQELYKVYEIKKVDKYSYLLIFGFSLFKSNKYYNWLYFGLIPFATLSSILLLLLFI